MKNLVLAAFVALSLITNAQEKNKKEKDPKYQYCFKETSFETDDYKIYVVDAVNVAEKAKFKIRIFNKTNDYLVFKPSDLIFKFNGGEFPSIDKQMVIAPNDESSKVIDAKGKNMQTEKFTIEIKAMYKVAANSPGLKTENFDLPASKNDFNTGNFKCKLVDSKLKTDKSSIKFGCTYEGDGIGIIDPYKAAAIMPKGKENANIKKYTGMLMEKGKYEDFFVEFKDLPGAGDMQKESFKIKWNDTFRESKIVPLKGGTISMEIDGPKSIEKNK